MTLPERTLSLLAAIDGDRARAIVQATDAAASAPPGSPGPIEVVPIGDRAAVVIVGRCRSLARIPWIRPVEIAPSRYLISIETGTSVDSLEVALLDLLEESPHLDEAERAVLEKLLALVRRRRRDRTITKGEILFIPPEQARRAR